MQQILDIAQQNKRINTLKKVFGLLLLAGTAVALAWAVWVVMTLFGLPAILEKASSPGLSGGAVAQMLVTEILFVPTLALAGVLGLFKAIRMVKGKIAAAVLVAEFGLVMEKNAGTWQALYYGANGKTIIFGQSESLDRAQDYAAMRIIAFDLHLLQNGRNPIGMSGPETRQAFDEHVNAGRPVPDPIPIPARRSALKA